MKIKLLAVGKTDSKEIQSLIDDYMKRLKKYIDFKIEIIPDIKNRKNLSINEQKKKESELILAKIQSSDVMILLDDKGKTFSSMQFSKEMQKRMNSGVKQLVYVIGGPYGFDETVYKKATSKLSLSSMTFSHQMVRLFFVEQIYRAYSILNNTPYHHE